MQNAYHVTSSFVSSHRQPAFWARLPDVLFRMQAYVCEMHWRMVSFVVIFVSIRFLCRYEKKLHT